MFGVDQVEVRAWHQVGKELKIETNVGEMKLTVRHANWEMNKPRYMFNWVGKSEFKTGPFSSFSPIDTKMNFLFNTRKMVLNADMVETMGGKQWGLKIHKNRFSILTGNAA